MKKFFLYGLGFIGLLIACGLIALIVAPSLQTPIVYKDAYVESIDPDIVELEKKIPSLAQLIINPQFDDSWSSDVEKSYHDMQKAHDDLDEIKAPSEWTNDHSDLMDSISNCVASLDMLRSNFVDSSESLMDLCIVGIERFRSKIEPFIER